MHHDFGSTIHRRGHHRRPRRQSLDRRQRQALIERRQDHDVRERQPSVDVGTIANEAHRIVQLQARGLRLQRTPLGAFPYADQSRMRKLAAHEWQRLQEHGMALLGLEPPHDHENRVPRPETQALLETGGRLTSAREPSQVTPILDDDHLGGRQRLLVHEVASVGARDGDEAVHEAAGQSVHDIARFQTTLPPVLPHVWRLNDHGHSTKAAHGRGEQAALAQHLGQAKRRPQVAHAMEAQGNHRHVRRHVRAQLGGRLRRAHEQGTKAGAVQATQEGEDVLLRASPCLGIIEVCDVERPHDVASLRQACTSASERTGAAGGSLARNTPSESGSSG